MHEVKEKGLDGAQSCMVWMKGEMELFHDWKMMKDKMVTGQGAESFV